MLKFTPVNFRQERKYNAFYDQCDEKSSDYTFINMWSWQDKYRYEWAFADNLCWLRHREGEKIVYNCPIGNWRRDDWKELLQKHFPAGFLFTRVPDALYGILNEQFDEQLEMTEERDHWEYIYSIQELTSLNGYRFRNKRKLSTQFKQLYNYIYKKVEPEHIPDIIAFQRQWLSQPEVSEDKCLDGIKDENRAILRMLENWQKLPSEITGGFISIDGSVVACALGEKIDDNTIAVHFEKALYGFRGAYQAINRIFLENVGCYYRFVNREQDLGIPGLRKSKLDYNPVRFIKKYTVSRQFSTQE